MPSLSYKERSLYGMLAANLIVYVPYFFVALHGHASLQTLIATIFVLILVNIFLQIIVASTTRNRLTDERDRLIEARGYRAAYIALVSGIVLIFAILWIHAPADINHPHFGALHLINVLLAALVVSEVVKVLAQLIDYRRSL